MAQVFDKVFKPGERHHMVVSDKAVLMYTNAEDAAAGAIDLVEKGHEFANIFSTTFINTAYLPPPIEILPKFKY